MDIIASNKNNTLDPLSVIVKLFIYLHKPVGTKISIGNNMIYSIILLYKKIPVLIVFY